MVKNLSYIVFTDFDGTITRNDIGDLLFRQFGDEKICLQNFLDYREEKINAFECWQKTCATVASVSHEQIRDFVRTQEVQTGFPSFINFCRENSIPVYIVSDGFDYYIREVLEREGFSDLPFISNSLRFEADGTISPLFPHSDAECRKCANCKRNHLLSLAGDEHVIVYIGDGYSDTCPARYADVVFAKGQLLNFCERENITYHRFQTFSDVESRLRKVMSASRPKHRRTAEFLRKEIFMQG